MIGLALVAWFAIPTVQEVLVGASDYAILAVALLHALALYVSILVHELGHALTAMRRGYEVDGVTLTIIGGHTTVQSNYRRALDQAGIAFAGPLATLFVGVAGWALAANTSGLVHSVASWLAWSSVIIGAVNLLPGVPLDGGAILDAVVWRFTRNRKLGRQVSALSGLGVAALWTVSPWIVGWYFGRDVQTSDVIISGVVGLWMASTAWRVFVWAGRSEIQSSTAERASTKQASVEPDVTVPAPNAPHADDNVRKYVRRATAVTINATVAQALVAAHESAAGAVVVTADNRIVGIVREAAVADLSDSDRLTTAVSSVARRIDKDDHIRVDATFADISQQLANHTAQEWLVVDDVDATVGVLFRSDIPRSNNV